MRKTLCRLIAAMQATVMLIGLLPVLALAEHTPNIIAFSGAEKKSCAFAESGIYRIYAFGRGGDGGNSVEFSHDDDFYGPSGGGGGSGGVCGHEAAFAAGEVISLDFDGDTLTVSGSNILLICGSGEKGEDAYYDSDISYGAGIGGRAGTASGGNVLNKSVGGGSGITLPTTLENPGGSGGFVDTPYSDYGFGCGGKGGDGVLPDEEKNCGEKGGAAAVIIEYISPAVMTMVLNSEPATLAEHSIGTVFKLREDGTLHDWILISHNYEGTGNQLLMRNDTIYYHAPVPASAAYTYHYNDSDDGRTTSSWAVQLFADSPIMKYLNNEYLTDFNDYVQSKLVEVNMPIVTGGKNCIAQKCSYTCGVNTMTLTGTTPVKALILSRKEVFGDDPGTGSFINYFSTAEKIASNTAYGIRDSYYTCGSNDDNYGYELSCCGIVDTSGKLNRNAANELGSSGFYYRPCIVLAADTLASANEEIGSAYSDSKAGTLAGNPVGTKFMIMEDGVEQEWFLVDHNYQGIGNQLLMRKNTVLYNTLPKAQTVNYHYDDSEDGWCKSSFLVSRFDTSDIYQYFNDYYVGDLLTPALRESIVNIGVPMFTDFSNCSYTVAYSSHGSKPCCYTIKQTPVESKIFVLSTYEAGLLCNKKQVTRSDKYLRFFSFLRGYEASELTASAYAADNYYYLRDGIGYCYSSMNSATLYSNSSTKYKYYRPCIVLPGDISAEAGEEITGEIRPTIENIDVTTEWAAINTAEINALNAESYAVTAENTEPVDGWQESSCFELNANGTYFAWAKSKTNNTVSMQFTVSRVDSFPPEIVSVSEQRHYAKTSTVTIAAEDTESGIAGYALSVSADASAVAWQTGNAFDVDANGWYYVFVKDNAGHISSQQYEVIKVDKDPPVISTVTFNDDSSVITVTAEDNASGVSSITIDGTVHNGSSAVHSISDGTKHIDIYAEDSAGNISETVTQRVPGWFDILNTITIDSVEMIDKDNRILEITASSIVDPVFGILIDGVLHAGNPVRYTVPAGEKLLELQAQDINGDRSEIYTHYVAGFEEEISSLTVMSMTFDNDCSSVEVTAAETGNAAAIRGIKGIQVNGEFLSGNPVNYIIPAGTTEITARAINNDGDYSAPMTKQVPKKQGEENSGGGGGNGSSGGGADSSDSECYSIPQLTIHRPSWTNGESTRVYIEANDEYGIRSIMAKTGKSKKWEDLTKDPYITVSEDCTVYAYTVNWDGRKVETQKDIVCFDRASPTVKAELHDDVVIISTADDLSGVVGIYVNGAWHKGAEIAGGFYRYAIPDGITSISVMALDAAGNISRTATVAVPTKPLPPPEEIKAEESEPPKPVFEAVKEAEPVVIAAPLQSEAPAEPEESNVINPVVKTVIAVSAVGIVAAVAAAAWIVIRQRRKQHSDFSDEFAEPSALDESFAPPEDEEAPEELFEEYEKSAVDDATDFVSSTLGERFKNI